MKTCNKCGEERELEFFQKDKRNKDGRGGWCKSCVAAYNKQYRADNRDKIAAYREANREKMSSYNKKYREDNPDRITALGKKYREENREKLDARLKKYREENPDRIAARHAEYTRNRYHNDPAFRLLLNLRTRLGRVLKGTAKHDSTVNLVGCTIEQLKSHLERQFTDGMTWENQGEWHVDHIRPCASFDLSKEEDQRECFNYKNLQPLWAEDNRRKSNKIVARHELKKRRKAK
jgi:hypothetical protein